jgi:ferredoxin
MGRFRDLLGKVAHRALGEGAADAPAGSPGAATTAAGAAATNQPLDPIPARWNEVIKESPAAAEGVATVTVRIENEGLEVSVPLGTTLLDAAIEAGSNLDHYCGGMCSCGSCRLAVVSGHVSAIEAMEESTLNVVREGEADRLACQTRALGDVVLRVPEE